MIGSVHPTLAYNRYTEEARDSHSLSYDFEVKYFPCEGIDYVGYELGSNSLRGAAWVVLRTLGADLLDVNWRSEMKLHPALACEDVPDDQVVAARRRYLDSLVLSYIAMAKYLHHFSLGSKILKVAVVLPTLGDIVSYNKLYGEADEVQMIARSNEIREVYYSSLKYFELVWRKCTKMLLVSEKDILYSCSCGAVFPRGDDFTLFHLDYFHLNEVGMGKLIQGTREYLIQNYARVSDMTINSEGYINSARVDMEVDAIESLVNAHTVRSPRVAPRQSGWGWSTKAIELLHGCERCLIRKKAQSSSEEQKLKMDQQIDLLIARGFWLED